MVLPVLSALLVLPFLVLAHPTPNSDGPEVVKRSLPSRWYQERGHPVEKLFMRQTEPTDGVNYPAIGSPQWSQGYPPVPPDPTQMPQEWTNALNAAVNAGKIPNIPPSTSTNPQNPTPVYEGVNPGDPSVCSASYGCRAPGDIWDAPNGTIGISFDDGPSLVRAYFTLFTWWSVLIKASF
jgi:chitin deacetylase